MLSITAEIYEISIVKFLDIYLNFHKSMNKLREIGVSRKIWHGKFTKDFKEIVKEKQHNQYNLTHQKEKLKRFLSEKTQIYSDFKPKIKRYSLLDERIQDFLGKSNEFLRKTDKKMEIKEKKLFWNLGTRSKSEEKMAKIHNYKISALEEKKTGKRPLSVNLNNIMKINEKEEKGKEFVKKQLLFKRMKVDKLFEERDIRKQINSIFKGKKQKGSEPKLTSFQLYLKENQRIKN